MYPSCVRGRDESEPTPNGIFCKPLMKMYVKYSHFKVIL